MEQNSQVLRSFDEKTTAVQDNSSSFPTPVIVVIFIVAILIGAGAGYAVAGQGGGTTTAGAKKSIFVGITAPKTAGTKDSKKFPDTAEGTLKEGGLDGEGNFHLERPGGESQNVYLTSSIVDLSQYVGKKIRVMGQTFKGNKAGWLMDVGYVEIL